MQFDFRDGGADLHLSVSECATGWSLKGQAGKGKQQVQTVPFAEVWDGSGRGCSVDYRYSLETLVQGSDRRWFPGCVRQSQAEVVGKKTNKIHQT